MNWTTIVEALPLIVTIYEAVIRIVPTQKSWSLVNNFLKVFGVVLGTASDVVQKADRIKAPLV